ncbi:uncharacterized protein [Typha angustifolia]|uniref:uncharacterized protein n=1 Tax=Typha angustifolia TaxID=59011 RepID=UPI003C2B2A2D
MHQDQEKETHSIACMWWQKRKQKLLNSSTKQRICSSPISPLVFYSFQCFSCLSTFLHTAESATVEAMLFQLPSGLHLLHLFFFLIMAAVAAALPFGSLTCRSYCGNITVDYPFGLQAGCGHAGFRELLFCINGMLMLHIPSGSYRVLDIDYAYRGLTLHDPAMSDCYALRRRPHNAVANDGFVVERWRVPYLQPDPDNVFMLLGCSADSPLFQGFPDRHLPCRNISGMGCEDYYRCPVWDRRRSPAYGEKTNPPECCAVEFAAIREINMSHLGCEGYSSAYSLAPVRPPGPGAWAYGIRLAYSLPMDNKGFCGACQATGGVCGHDSSSGADLCLCGDWNSTSNCDSKFSSLAPAIKSRSLTATLAWGLLFPLWFDYQLSRRS